MKTLLKISFVAMFTLIVATTTSMAALAGNATFNKIRINGNVKLELVQGLKEKIEISGDYSSKSTSFKKQGYTLIISSFEYAPVVIKVTVKDLQRIDACGDVVVETIGKFDLKYLQVFLKDNAKATVKANAESMYTYIKGNANLKLSGHTLDHTVLTDTLSKLNMDNLVAVKTTKGTVREVVVYTLNTK